MLPPAPFIHSWTDLMIRADVHQPYFRKFLFVFLGCVGFGLYFLYDGLIGYPSQLTIAEAYEELPEAGRLKAWKELATEKGWPTRTPPKSAEEIRRDIPGQFVWATICMVLSIPFLLKFISGQGTWVEGDESLLRNSKGQEVPIESITRIDKQKWEAKGIAKIFYEVDGKKKKFVMDDFKYKREEMGELMKFAEAPLSEDQIVGDFLERDKEAIARREAEEANADDGYDMDEDEYDSDTEAPVDEQDHVS